MRSLIEVARDITTGGSTETLLGELREHVATFDAQVAKDAIREVQSKVENAFHARWVEARNYLFNNLGLTELQRIGLAALVEQGSWPGGWHLTNRSRTLIVMKSLVRKGLAELYGDKADHYRALVNLGYHSDKERTVGIASTIKAFTGLCKREVA